MELRAAALQALTLHDPFDKARAARALGGCAAGALVSPDASLAEPVGLPGRPRAPRLVPPRQVPRRSPATPEGLAHLVHALCHIEFNAINLALDAVWRFPGLPETYYREWVGIAAEEAGHFILLHDHLQNLGLRYGDVDAHDGLWEMCLRTRHSALARMALVPRTLEARGLDVTPDMQLKLRQTGLAQAVAVANALDTILRDEIGHVSVGNRWYQWLCQRQGLDPEKQYRALLQTYRAAPPRPPLNERARLDAGFSHTELFFWRDEGTVSRP